MRGDEMQDEVLHIRIKLGECRIVTHLTQGAELVAIAIKQLDVQRASGFRVELAAPRRIKCTLPTPESLSFVMQTSGNRKRPDIVVGQADSLGGLLQLLHYGTLMGCECLFAGRHRANLFRLGLTTILIDYKPTRFAAVLALIDGKSI
jgi:hypothetical protein